MRRLMLAVLLVAGCSTAAPGAVAPVEFGAIDDVIKPEALAVHGDTLLIGTRPTDHPELFLRDKDARIGNVRLAPATPYGKEAHWYQIASDGTTVHGVGGERGGAHGNVRWSAWTGDADKLVEKPQGFSTFGGYGAGELIGVVSTSTGPRIIGTWGSAKAGLDIATWTYANDTWTRQSSAGTALESSPELLRFPTAATENNGGILIAGWQIANGTPGAAVWQYDGTTWTATTLPEGDAALAARCWDGTCHVVGRYQGKLAWWKSQGSGWTKVKTPDIPVGDQDDLAAPVPVDGTPTLLVDHGGVKLVSEQNERATKGPVGKVSGAATLDGQTFVIAGDRLWQILR